MHEICQNLQMFKELNDRPFCVPGTLVNWFLKGAQKFNMRNMDFHGGPYKGQMVHVQQVLSIALKSSEDCKVPKQAL